MSAKVSIIVPVYNLEKYIENCLKSICTQTYNNIEIICIDDGSSDASADIIKRLSVSDSRIKYIHQENAGVSAARNNGMACSQGQYIMFVDGDDFLHPQAVEILLKCIIDNNADMVCSDFTVTSDLNCSYEPINDYSCVKVTDETLFSGTGSEVRGKSSCAKIFRREFSLLSDFPVGISRGEDGYYIIKLLCNDAEIFVVDCSLYYYYSRDNSVSHSSVGYKNIDIVYSFDMICDFLSSADREFLKAYSLQYLFQAILYNRTYSIGTSWEKEVCDECKRIGKKWIKEFIGTKRIKLHIRILFTVFFRSRFIYETARAVLDPTMKDFYKSRRKRKKELVK